MKYFLDTEFHEYHKQVKVANIKVGKAIPTIDLISIGIVSEDIRLGMKYGLTDNGDSVPIESYSTGKEYYDICKDFNLKDAWHSNQGTGENPNFWLRDNVLNDIYISLVNKYLDEHLQIDEFSDFTLGNFKTLLSKYGKTKKDIVRNIITFIYGENGGSEEFLPPTNLIPEFYAYYADYDWVVFAQLFGKMMDLPKGFPMYCNDLKQTLDTYIKDRWLPDSISYMKGMNVDITFDLALERLESLDSYPKQDNEHNALDDAKWNKKLYEFLNTLK